MRMSFVSWPCDHSCPVVLAQVEMCVVGSLSFSKEDLECILAALCTKLLCSGVKAVRNGVSATASLQLPRRALGEASHTSARPWCGHQAWDLDCSLKKKKKVRDNNKSAFQTPHLSQRARSGGGMMNSGGTLTVLRMQLDVGTLPRLVALVPSSRIEVWPSVASAKLTERGLLLIFCISD